MTKKKVRKTCRVCSKKFYPKKSNDVYCASIDCKRSGKNSVKRQTREASKVLAKKDCKGHQRHTCTKQVSGDNKSRRCRDCKRIQGRWKGLFESNVGYKLKGALERAGNVDSFPTLDDVKALFELATIQAKGVRIYNGSNTPLFEICHRYPLSGQEGTVGLYSRANLTIAPVYMNRRNSNNVIHADSVYGTHFVNKNELRQVGKIPKKVSGDNKFSGKLRKLLYKKFGVELVLWIDSMELKPRPKSKGIDPEVIRHSVNEYEMACLLSNWLGDGYAEEIGVDVKGISYNWFTFDIVDGVLTLDNQDVKDNVLGYFSYQLTGEKPVIASELWSMLG